MRLLIFFLAIWIILPAGAIAQFGQKTRVPQKKEESKRKPELKVIHPAKPVPGQIRINRSAPECPCTVIKIQGIFKQSVKLLKEKDKISNWKHITFGSSKDYADVLDRLKQGHRVSAKPQTRSDNSDYAAAYQTSNDIQLDFKPIPYPISIAMLETDDDDEPWRVASLQPERMPSEEPATISPTVYSYSAPAQYSTTPSYYEQTAVTTTPKMYADSSLPTSSDKTKASRSVSRSFTLLFKYSLLVDTAVRPATYSQPSKFTLLFRFKHSGE